MKKLPSLSLLFLVVLLTSCNKDKISNLEKQLEIKKQEVVLLQNQIDNLEQTNGGLLDRMADLSVISKTGAESINESLKSLSQQYGFIQNLTTKMQSKDSVNLALVMNLKRSLMDVDDEDVFVEVRGGLVHVSISDKLLFSSGSDKINSKAEQVLGKIATVINDHEQLDVMIEGHTDNVPINNSCMEDNWDLSVKRATAVVRNLAEDHFVDPLRMTASGRSEYDPKADNESEFGRSKNRRTEIVITPKLDQFFKLLEAPKVNG